MNPRILIIGLVWPEPTSSAAGWRVLQIIEQLQLLSNDIHFSCAAGKSDASFDLEQMDVIEHQIKLNSDTFNDFIKDLNPTIVIYDRFLVEEQFGWRVKKMLPQCFTILDTEDLHFVRRARAEAFKKQQLVNYDTTDCYRELSAIYRCDLSIIISKVEFELLVNKFNIPDKQLIYLPFLEKNITNSEIQSNTTFSNRHHFLFIGNMLHEPNYQTVLQLKKLWPNIRKQIPNSELHIYGAYMTEKVYQLQNANEKFFIKGKAEDVNVTMQNYRVLLAPIPFGAGLKGKFIDAFRNGLPSVTSAIGSEGYDDKIWGGFVVDDEIEFVKNAVKIYSDESVWNEMVKNGYSLINDMFSQDKWNGKLVDRIFKIYNNIEKHRSDLFIQKILWQNSLQATKYMSLWIEAKNK